MISKHLQTLSRLAVLGVFSIFVAAPTLSVAAESPRSRLERNKKKQADSGKRQWRTTRPGSSGGGNSGTTTSDSGTSNSSLNAIQGDAAPSSGQSGLGIGSSSQGGTSGATSSSSGGGGGGSGGGGGGSGGGTTGSTPASTPGSTGTPGTPGATPLPSNLSLTVTCGTTSNVLKWKLLPNRNSNTINRNVDGGNGSAVWSGPLNVDTYTDTNVQAGKTYSYTHKSSPACASNVFHCPSGAYSGTPCASVPAGAPPPPGGGGSGGGGGGGTGGGPDLMECTGGNPKCICVKEINKFRGYGGLGRDTAIAAFLGEEKVPAGMSADDATKKICDFYNLNPTLGAGSICRPQADEVVFHDINPVDPRYPDVSVDVITSAGALWGKAIAACEPGVH